MPPIEGINKSKYYVIKKALLGLFLLEIPPLQVRTKSGKLWEYGISIYAEGVKVGAYISKLISWYFDLNQFFVERISFV